MSGNQLTEQRQLVNAMIGACNVERWNPLTCRTHMSNPHDYPSCGVWRRALAALRLRDIKRNDVLRVEAWSEGHDAGHRHERSHNPPADARRWAGQLTSMATGKTVNVHSKEIA